jgi:uncharacterized membrane protein YtjA (UPF0391 family)
MCSGINYFGCTLAIPRSVWHTTCTGLSRGGFNMLHYALVFLVIAIIAAFLGFGGIAGAFVGIAKILFFLFLIAFVVSLVMNVARRA